MPATNALDVTVANVAASFINQPRQRLWQSIPLVMANTRKEGIGATTYYVPGDANSLINAQIHEVQYDEVPPADDDLSEGSVAVQPRLQQTNPIPAPRFDNESHRFEDLNNQIPLQLSRLDQGLDRMVMSALTSSTFFTSTGMDGSSALDAYPSDANPQVDLNDGLRALEHLRGFSGLKLVAKMDVAVAVVLAGYTAYQTTAMFSGDGERFDNVSINMDAFAAKFAMVHRLDRCEVYSGVYNTAQMGQTASLGRLQSGLFWIGFVDERQAEWDITVTNGRRAMGPNGAIAFATSKRKEYIFPWSPQDGTEVDKLNARMYAQVITPQYTAHSGTYGIFVPSTEVFT